MDNIFCFKASLTWSKNRIFYYLWSGHKSAEVEQKKRFATIRVSFEILKSYCSLEVPDSRMSVLLQ